MRSALCKCRCTKRSVTHASVVPRDGHVGTVRRRRAERTPRAVQRLEGAARQPCAQCTIPVRVCGGLEGATQTVSHEPFAVVRNLPGPGIVYVAEAFVAPQRTAPGCCRAALCAPRRHEPRKREPQLECG